MAANMIVNKQMPYIRPQTDGRTDTRETKTILLIEDNQLLKSDKHTFGNKIMTILAAYI